MIVGITGGIGSGKSYIAHGLEQYGFVRYDCDQEAKRIIEQDPDVKSQIVQLFGTDVYQDGKYQTHKVADIVFAQPALLQALNAIVHPAVKADILNLQSTIYNPQSSLLIESAILWESGLDQICHKVIAVIAPEELRIQRAIARDHSDTNKVRARIKAQMSDQERCQHADIIVNNNEQQTLDQLCQYILQHL